MNHAAARVQPACRAGLAAVLLLLAGGCARTVLTLEDAIAGPGPAPLVLMAHVERETPGALRTSVRGAPVEFLIDGRPAGTSPTDADGMASLTLHDPPPGVTSFTVRAQAGRTLLGKTGRVFHFSPARVILVTDIDNTIADTDVDDLILEPLDRESEPITGSREFLCRAARDFHVVYLTGRPRFLLEKTRRWLEMHGYPPGPVLVAPEISKAARYRRFKRATLRELRRAWPNALIGIGNRQLDAAVYGANDMLALIVDPPEHRRIGRHALVLRDWTALADFFDTNWDALTSPDRLEAALCGTEPLLLPIRPYEAPVSKE
jgi:hypothetical protein